MKAMALYQFPGLPLLLLAAFGLEPCSSGHTLTQPSPSLPEVTMPSLRREVEDNSRYKTLEANATLLKLLVDDKSGVSRSEVFDMLHSRDDNPDHMDLPSFPEDMETAKMDVTMSESQDPDSQAEFLQTPNKLVRKDSQQERIGRGGVGAAAGVMVATTCVIVTVAYGALLLYRRMYMKRHGLKHELLRNEENIAETRIDL